VQVVVQEGRIDPQQRLLAADRAALGQVDRDPQRGAGRAAGRACLKDVGFAC